jgi:hypothetical protein
MSALRPKSADGCEWRVSGIPRNRPLLSEQQNRQEFFVKLAQFLTGTIGVSEIASTRVD